MRVACCQLDIAWEDKPANYRRVERLVSEADLAPGTLLLLPEMFATGFTMNSAAVAEAVDGPTACFVADLARQRRLCVAAGVVIRDPAHARPRNECLVFGADGRPMARYAKTHLFSFAGETEHYMPGADAVLFDWQAARVAPAICYDLRFPEQFRAVIAEGAELLTLIACWPAPRQSHWLTLLAARAIENQCFVAAANRCGRDPSGLEYAGRSQILDPRGTVLADAGNQESVIQAEIDLEAQRVYRREFPALNDLRTVRVGAHEQP
jgi:predicted amidohydrolase